MSVIKECRKALRQVDERQILWTVHRLTKTKQTLGRVFVMGNGGGAAHASHFAADLRKIAGIQAFAFDSIPEMTARINDQGWEQAWYDWRSSFNWFARDMDFIFSVGGAQDGLSPNLGKVGPRHGIVGAKGAAATRIVIPSTSTPVIEGCQAVIAHDIVNRLVS